MAKILVVNNDRRLAERMLAELQTLGHETLAAYGATLALQAARWFPFDAALVAKTLPDVNLHELVQQLRDERPDSVCLLVAEHSAPGAHLLDGRFEPSSPAGGGWSSSPVHAGSTCEPVDCAVSVTFRGVPIDDRVVRYAHLQANRLTADCPRALHVLLIRDESLAEVVAHVQLFAMDGMRGQRRRADDAWRAARLALNALAATTRG